jgi:hypothetical protein
MNPIDESTSSTPVLPPVATNEIATNASSRQASFASQPSVFVPPSSSSNTNSEFDWKLAFIGLLCVLLVLSVIGVNISDMVQRFTTFTIKGVSALITAMLRLVGYTTGTVLDIAGQGVEVAGQGVEFAGKELSDVGESVLDVATPDKDSSEKDSSEKNSPSSSQEPENVPRDITYPQSMRKPDPALHDSNPPAYQWKGGAINPLASPAYQGDRKGQQWCLAGTFQGKRGCAAVDNPGQCMSGQLFPSQHACLAPE